MKLNLTIEILKKKNWYLARAPELDFISQERTPEEAKRNLLEVIKIQITEMEKMGTLEDYLQECGFETREDNIISKTEMVGFERIVVYNLVNATNNPKTLLKVFKMFGCQYKRKEGSHYILIYTGAKRVVVIPEYDEIDVEIIKK